MCSFLHRIYCTVYHQCVITPSVSGGCNSFAIVCVSVRPSFHLAILAKPMYIQTWILAYRSYLKISRLSLEVKVIVQRSRSLSPKTSSYTVIFQAVYRKPSWTLRMWLLCYSALHLIIRDKQWSILRSQQDHSLYSTPYMNGRATTLGVFKAYVVFFLHTISKILCLAVTLEVDSQEYQSQNGRNFFSFTTIV